MRSGVRNASFRNTLSWQNLRNMCDNLSAISYPSILSRVVLQILEQSYHCPSRTEVTLNYYQTIIQHNTARSVCIKGSPLNLQVKRWPFYSYCSCFVVFYWYLCGCVDANCINAFIIYKSRRWLQCPSAFKMIDSYYENITYKSICVFVIFIFINSNWLSSYNKIHTAPFQSNKRSLHCMKK